MNTTKTKLFMKKQGNLCDYVATRNQNLRREYFARLGRNGLTPAAAIAALVNARADRFYISEERAYQLLRKEAVSLKRGAPENTTPGTVPDDSAPVPDDKRLPTRLRMLGEIRLRVEALMERRPDLSLRDAVFEVVNSPAPEFYLTPRSIRTILYQSLRG